MLRPVDGPPRRLDVALVDALAAAGSPCSRTQLARAFATGDVTVQGVPAKAKTKVDDAVEVAVVLAAPEPLSVTPDAIDLSIIYEDEVLLVIDKPAHLVMHPGPGHPTGTLAGAVLHHLGAVAGQLPVLPGNDATRPGIVHRLDRDTSGVVVVAKTLPAQAALAEQFSTHDIERVYWALIDRAPTWSTRKIQTSHARDPAERRRFAPGHGGRKAVTYLTIIRRFGTVAAEVEATLETGRTHQIRMHARHVGHPVLADPLYGYAPGDPAVREVAEGLPRHALHAKLLGFVHPVSGEKMVFESPLPQALVDARDALLGIG